MPRLKKLPRRSCPRQSAIFQIFERSKIGNSLERQPVASAWKNFEKNKIARQKWKRRLGRLRSAGKCHPLTSGRLGGAGNVAAVYNGGRAYTASGQVRPDSPRLPPTIGWRFSFSRRMTAERLRIDR
jgi:hypothetical protein